MTDNAFTPTVAKKEVADVNNAGCMEDFIVISGKLSRVQHTEGK